MRKSKKYVALAAALLIALTTALGCIALAEENGKHFSILEAASDANALSIPEIAKKCRTSVVAIETEETVVYNDNSGGYYSPFDSMFGFPFGSYGSPYGGYGNRQREYTQTGAGSGVIVSEDGYIVTNNHVIAGVDKITVFVMDENGEETTYDAKLIGSSESNDIAVLKIEAEGLNAATFGDSDQLEIGELAVAIGNPMGTVHSSVTAGIISATERELTIDDVTISAIQTDAAINPGNSGGALFDSFGNVIGIVYAKSSSVSIEGIGYAIPVNDVKELISTMINDPQSVRAQTQGSQIMLGITIIDVTEEMSKQYSMPVGVYIREVADFSAAQRAGMTMGDIIIEFAGEPVTCADDLNAIKAKQTPGDIVTVKVDRNSRTVELELVIPQPTQVETVTE